MSGRPFQRKQGSTANSFAEFRASSGRSAGAKRKPTRDDKARGRGQDDNRGRFNDRRGDDRGDSRGFKPRDDNRSFSRNTDNRSQGRFNDRGDSRGFKRDDNRSFSRNNDRPQRNTDRSGNNGYERKKSFNQEPRRTYGKREVSEFRLQGIFEYGNDFCTPNAVPGQSVYGERFCKDAKGVEYRIWDPKRSKLGAALRKGVSQIGIRPGSTVLYLGCSTGTTVSHVGEIVGEDGKVYALDVAPRVLRDLLFSTAKRENIYPLMADASKPATFAHAVPKVDVVFMDIAQKDQVGIFLKNIKTFLKPGGFGLLSLKSRSVDITKRPVQVFKESRAELEKETVIVDYKELDPYEIDHAFFVVKKKSERENLDASLKPELN